MSGTEWLLVVLVILVPLALAVIVTKWTLDQALKRQRRNREPQGERVPTPLATDPTEASVPTGADTTSARVDSGSST